MSGLHRCPSCFSIPCRPHLHPKWSAACLLVIDTETTGPDPAIDEVIELGGVLFDQGAWVRDQVARFRPSIPIPTEATAIHGITADAVAWAPPFAADAVPWLTAAGLVAGYNLSRFDVPLLQRQLRASGCDWCPAQALDVYAFVSWHLRHHQERTLSAACAHFGVKLEGAHGAVADARATGELLLAMVGAGLIPTTIPEALSRCKMLLDLLDYERQDWSYHLYLDREDVEQAADELRLRVGFGKHRGLLLREVPAAYLGFCLDKFNDLPPLVEEAFTLAIEGKDVPVREDYRRRAAKDLRQAPQNPALNQEVCGAADPGPCSGGAVDGPAPQGPTEAPARSSGAREEGPAGGAAALGRAEAGSTAAGPGPTGGGPGGVPLSSGSAVAGEPVPGPGAAGDLSSRRRTRGAGPGRAPAHDHGSAESHGHGADRPDPQRTATLDLFGRVETGADLSTCRRYRYRLWRIWDRSKPLLVVLMLNPSTADETVNDPTVERCERRARAKGCGGLIVVNLFAFRAADPDEMKREADPIGPGNDAAIRAAVAEGGQVLCAWGNDGAYLGRSQEVRALLRQLGVVPLVLGLNATGEPKHPLYVAYGIEPTPWSLP